jgi:LuxR family maltose regulon positive regulatory protein
MQGDLEMPARWAETIKPTLHDKLDTLREFQWLILVRVLIAQRLPDEAAPLLGYLQQTAESEGRTGRGIEILALQALALEAQGRPVQALNALKKALSLAEREGYVRTFVDEGIPMAVLLRRALAQSIAPDYARRLLAAFDEPAAGPVLVEPLTRRELEVLRLIADGLKNPEIADHLVISVATVKRHVTNIYGKLGVSRRVQAIARAQDLGLL